ncbi:hypothetical protein M0R45_016133 [Rubus argutus]|uniref:Retrotransposon Copia-like N-terminal domain-containing protein n=1 Tax=Rubus argutus TaxID=59490 RepID=A0AAW1XVB5_RUBAR
MDRIAVRLIGWERRNTVSTAMEINEANFRLWSRSMRLISGCGAKKLWCIPAAPIKLTSFHIKNDSFSLRWTDGLQPPHHSKELGICLQIKVFKNVCGFRNNR